MIHHPVLIRNSKQLQNIIKTTSIGYIKSLQNVCKVSSRSVVYSKLIHCFGKDDNLKIKLDDVLSVVEHISIVTKINDVL